MSEVRMSWPYPESFTFAFEIEFIFEGQFKEIANNSHDETLCEEIRNRLELSTFWDLEKVADRHFYRNSGPFHVYEIRTSKHKKYYENTESEWDLLKRELTAIQKKLPLGFYNAHAHISCKNAISQNSKLIIDQRHFGIFIRMFEGMWYLLSGYGYDLFANRENILATFGLGFIENLKLCHNFAAVATKERGQGIFCHRSMINLSSKYPTIEIKTLSGLFDKEKENFDVEHFQYDVRWIFGLLKYLLGNTNKVPLALLGLPISVGEKPSLKQISHFLNLLFFDDPQGKANALNRLRSMENIPSKSPQHLISARRLEAAYPFYTLGLRVVYELHEEHEGWDEQVENNILHSPQLFRELCKDLKNAPVKLPLTEYFSHPELLKMLIHEKL